MSRNYSKRPRYIQLPNIQRKISEKKWLNYVAVIIPRKKGEINKYTVPVDYSAREHWNYSEVIERVCKKFGCGSTLTRREGMFSDYCVIHNNKNNVK